MHFPIFFNEILFLPFDLFRYTALLEMPKDTVTNTTRAKKWSQINSLEYYSFKSSLENIKMSAL